MLLWCCECVAPEGADLRRGVAALGLVRFVAGTHQIDGRIVGLQDWS